MHEALLMLHEETLEHSWKRHEEQHRRLKAGLETLGFSFLVDTPWRLPQLNAVILPPNVGDEAHLRKRLLNEFSLEVGAGLGDLSGKIWRIGLMGHTAHPQNVDFLLEALSELLH
jgi:alanine-glyoxylate transaminase/serine-glyoxylate transaminase/serine-pyruvate transaminase